ncbi:MAG TPA: MDR family MFS transporter, partial [Thermoanaerobaculia bacterium]|nr:MDR family MFS transporter [Thermoanaerobaculia bacterium]
MLPALPLPPGRRPIVTAGIITGMFLAALEATVVATAMPTVIAALGGMNHYSWVFSAYLVASTVTVPVWGKLSDLYGRRLFYQIGVAIFLVGSILSGVSTSMAQLIFFRTIQGLGAGALVPLGMTIIGEIFTVQERARMQGLFSGVWGLASIVGPLLGGLITDQWSWRWVFFVNVPFGIASALIIGFGLVEPKREGKRSIDYAGAVLLTLAVTILLLALVEGGGGSGGGLLGAKNLGLLTVSGVLLAAFVAVERRAAEPIVPLSLFRNRVVSIGIGIGFLAGIAMFGAITFVPLFAQGARGDSATAAGSLLTPLMLSWVTMSIVGGRLLLRVGYRPMVLTGLAFLTAAFAIFWTFGRTTPRIWLLADLALLGAGLGLTMLTLLLAVQHSVGRGQLGIATSLNQFSRSIGGAVGVAVMGAALAVSLHANLLSAARASDGALPIGIAQRLADNPSALVDPAERVSIDPAMLVALQESLAASVRPVFLIG